MVISVSQSGVFNFLKVRDVYKYNYVVLQMDIHSVYSESRTFEELLKDGDSVRLSETARFLLMYINQVFTILQFIKAGRSANFELHLSSLNGLMRYFRAHDLNHYGRMIPVYIQKMLKLKREDPDLYQKVSDTYTVKRTKSWFNNLFNDQALEQQIKILKQSGGIVGITQMDKALLRYFLISTELLKMSEQFKNMYSYLTDDSKEHHKHHLLSETVVTVFTSNAVKLKEVFEPRFSKNPFTPGIEYPLQHFMTGALVPDTVKIDILSRDMFGQALYNQFIEDRLDASFDSSMMNQKMQSCQFGVRFLSAL